MRLRVGDSDDVLPRAEVERVGERLHVSDAVPDALETPPADAPGAVQVGCVHLGRAEHATRHSESHQFQHAAGDDTLTVPVRAGLQARVSVHHHHLW